MTVILVVIFLVAILAISYILQRNRATKNVKSAVDVPEMGLGVPDLRTPKGMFFHPGHTWVTLMNGGNVRVGIDDFISKLTGPVRDIEIPQVGTEVAQGTPGLTLKFDSKMLHLPIPISGMVQKINQLMVEQPAQIGSRPLAREWLIDIAPSKLSDEVKALNIAEQVRDWINSEMERIKDFLLAQSGRAELVGATFPDGGEPVRGVLNMLDPEGIQQFEKMFLQGN